ncbi:hypothetical protein GCM10027037_13660 [Mucilaginibacter koreensis]
MTVDTSPNSGFQFLFDNNPQPMWIYDAQTLQILRVNHAAVLRYGYSSQEFLQKNLADFYAESAVLNSGFNEATQNQSAPATVQHLTKGGALLDVRVHIYALIYNGAQAHLMQISIDDSKALTQSLTDIHLRLDRVLNKTPVGYCQVDCSWTITNWNPAMQQLIEYRSEDVMHKNFWLVLPELSYTDFYINCHKARNEQTTVEFIHYFWPLQKWFSVLVYPAEGGLVFQLKDMTNKKLFENALVDKLEQLKQVSFFNSHFIRKPVASLIGLTQLVEENLVDVTHFKDVAGYILESSRELDDMLKRMNKMLNADKNTYLQRTLNGFYLDVLLQETVNSHASFYPNVQFKLEASQATAFYGNEKAIQAAIKSVLDSAINIVVTEQQIVIKSQVKNGHYIISAQNRDTDLSSCKLLEYFEAYNRNKITPSISSGMAKMFAIVKKHHGNFWAETLPAGGSELFISFPLANMASYKLNKGDYFSVYQQPRVILHHNAGLQCLTANWIGFHDAESVKAWAIEILHTVRKEKPRLLLIDNSNLLGVWEGAVRWVNFEWTPKVYEEGVTHIAIVYSTCAFSRLSADHVKLHLRAEVVIQHFATKIEAVNWLNAQQNIKDSDSN